MNNAVIDCASECVCAPVSGHIMCEYDSFVQMHTHTHTGRVVCVCLCARPPITHRTKLPGGYVGMHYYYYRTVCPARLHRPLAWGGGGGKTGCTFIIYILINCIIFTRRRKRIGKNPLAAYRSHAIRGRPASRQANYGSRYILGGNSYWH